MVISSNKKCRCCKAETTYSENIEMTETVQMRDNSKRKSADRLSSIVDRVSPVNPATITTTKKNSIGG